MSSTLKISPQMQLICTSNVEQFRSFGLALYFGLFLSGFLGGLLVVSFGGSFCGTPFSHFLRTCFVVTFSLAAFYGFLFVTAF